MVKPVDYAFYVFVCFLFAICYLRSEIFDSRDPYQCNAALTSGQWLDGPDSHRRTKLYSNWQATGCMTKSYNGKNAIECLASPSASEIDTEAETENVFFGDSTVRDVFWATARQLNPRTAAQEMSKADKHADITFTEGKATISFYWDPFLNSSRITQYLGPARSAASTDAELVKDNGIVVLGGGLWFAKEFDETKSVEEFKDTMDSLFSRLPLPDYSSKGRHRPIVLPVEHPMFKRLDASHDMMTKTEIERMNLYLKELNELHDIDLLAAFLSMADGVDGAAYEPKGIHVVPTIADRQAELMLNLKCNDLKQKYPYDATCCYEYPWHVAEIIILGAGFALFTVCFWLQIQIWTETDRNSSLKPLEKYLDPILYPILTLWGAALYCYVSDRTHLFYKVNKLYNAMDFWILMGAIAVLGLSTIKRSEPPKRPNQEKAAPVDQPFLSRDQTDEWKGWMQLMILAYHYTGASKIIDIYRVIRLLVASYLFMSGYGHAAYFYQKNDYSMKRVVSVMLRLNILSCLLPWVMDTDYLFYYFAPLVSYWYIVIYLTMWVKNEWNSNLMYLMGKICAAAAFTTVLHLQQWLFDPLFDLIDTVFGCQWEGREWLFRASLDQYIVYIGMVVAILYIRATKPPPPPPPPQSSMATTSHTESGRNPNLTRSLYFVAASTATIVYVIYAPTQTTKTSSNALHTYISALPILAFIYFRNCTQSLRNYYSGAFAWVGKISLETFVLQYHIWLAGDTKGLLSLGWFGTGGMADGTSLLGPWMGLGRWLDCLVLGSVFIWVSYHVANKTGSITAFVVKQLFK